ncbi:GNAT family N-acetyltransferase [Alcaligenes aquatilis]|uniref:GNAT family N-acetyltransferase n=1 Tax=Alcaligenes aquatilis TaxID=323284 RepID=UPI002AA7B1E9|nr:GNAT family N-acetyltransferase [Alcaligenes faecalis]
MTDAISLHTERLILRPWKPTDLEPFYRLNSDPHALRFYPATLDREQSDAIALRSQSLIEEHGWGPWAVELKEKGAFIGMVGLNRPTAELYFQPCVELLWRLLPEYWGKGYATEAARACMDFAFNELDLEQIVAYTAQLNRPSQTVMQRLGMTKQPGTFAHPGVPVGHQLVPHVLYTQDRKDWSPSA